MKRVLSIVLVATVVFSVTACKNSRSGGGSASTTQGGEIVLMVSAAGTLDDRSFNEACYNAMKQFCVENDMTYSYYQPTEDTAEAQIILFDTAVKAGARFFVIGSDQYKVSASMFAEKYPNIPAIIYDSVPVDEDGNEALSDNLLAVHFAEQQAGFLAGYAAVKEGRRKIGYMGGMAVPAVVRFGYGFVQGADTAAVDLGLSNVEIMYNYSGNFEATPENQARAASWYQNGTEIIFVAAGPMGSSVFAAAEQNRGLVIGVDSDQYAESETIITSAIKDLRNITYNTLNDWKAGKFKGNAIVTYTAREGGVGLAWEHARFKSFSRLEYDDIYKRLAENTSGLSDALADDTMYDDPAGIPLKAAKLTYIP
ncbi:MAG: BMP family ABC transporter substrate-binding protein [Treponema sp.]|nr:BMP family ABC transporter substrate-binding protein [Treponema sp.]